MGCLRSESSGRSKAMNKTKIYISGMNSGQNPASGLGIARCLRKAFPGLTLVGVDHSQSSTGLHDPTLDEVLMLPQWSQVDDALLKRQILDLLREDHLWISSMDMGVHWIAENIGRHARILAPGQSALDRTAKPAVVAFNGLGFRVPDHLSAHAPDEELHSFLRQNSWQCWLKSPYHDDRRISSWGTFQRTRDYLSKNWRTRRLFLQKHVPGNEETIAFAAIAGELIGAVALEKRQITAEGKTWAGRVSPVDSALESSLREVVRRLEWSGGGELEYVRDSDGQRWIIECNPRFPAWIYGAALAGMNLPGRLVGKILDLPLLENVSRYPFFTRVVQEVPAREEIGIPLPPDPSAVAWAGDGKQGKAAVSFSSFLPVLNETETEDEQEQQAERVPIEMASEIEELTRSFRGETPARLHLERWTSGRFGRLARRVRSASRRDPSIQIAYSIKTSPTEDFIRKARTEGFLAECISQAEVRRALDAGWKPGEIILNGPGKFWPTTTPMTRGLRLLFCDSVEEFERVLILHEHGPSMARGLGFRMRIPKLSSRFGNELGEFENFQRILQCIRKLGDRAELGFHFHMPSWSIGVQSWMHALDALLLWCQSIERLTKKPILHLDLGGGFFPSDLESLEFAKIQAEVRSLLPSVRHLYFEPGRSMTQDGEILVSRVLDVRRDREGRPTELVVDACIAELPLAQAYPHRVFFRAEGDAQSLQLRRGKNRILGRICMEDDILAQHVEVPEGIQIGDQIIFGDAGGYERSMSYDFGRG